MEQVELVILLPWIIKSVNYIRVWVEQGWCKSSGVAAEGGRKEYRPINYSDKIGYSLAQSTS